MELRQLTRDDEKLLHDFLDQHPYGCIEQSFFWGRFQTQSAARPAFFVYGVFKEGELIASMLLIEQVMGRGLSWLWCPMGPVLPLEDPEGAWDVLKQACDTLAKERSSVFTRLEPGAPIEQHAPYDWPITLEAYLPRHTLMLPLELSEEELLKQMAQKGRYNIKQAQKKGVLVRQGGPEDFDRFYALLRDTGARDGFSVHPKGFYEAFLKELGDLARFYVAELEGEVVSGALMTTFGDTATYYYGASSSKDRSSRASYLLQWQAALDAKKDGFLWYDFLGVAAEGAKKDPLAGVTQFKTRFGGHRSSYHASRVKVYRRGWWLVRKLLKYVARLRR